MSRCFPFPPPGYSGKCSSNDALILSIKLQREREKSNPDRERERTIKSSEKKKDRKKLKKEKKEKKREQKASSETKNEKQKLIEKVYQVDECRVEPYGKSTLQEGVPEQLERSSVTEEHGGPCSQNVSSSSDSTGNNCKRKRLPTPPSGIQSNGSAIRIRLSTSHMREEPSTSGSKEHEKISLPLQMRSDLVSSHSKVQPCSNIIRTDPSNRQRNLNVKAQDLSRSSSMSNAAIQLVTRQDKAVIGLPSQNIQLVTRKNKVVPCLPPQKTEAAALKEKLSSHEKKLQKAESKYNKLFANWVPPLQESSLVAKDDDDADDWLFGKKSEDRVAKRLKSSNSESCRDCLPSFALQPRAQFLPDVGIYALPYTLPF